MAESLAVAPALNTMTHLCSLLAFGASVSQSSWVVEVASRTNLLALTTLACLSQPVRKIQSIVSKLWGHDRRRIYGKITKNPFGEVARRRWPKDISKDGRETRCSRI